MSSVNRIVLIGRIKEAPEVKETTSGIPVARFTLVVDRPETQGGTPSGQDAVPVVAWRQSASSAAELSAGELVLVDGRILTRSYETEMGQRRWVTEVESRELKSLVKGSGTPSTAPVQAKAPTSSLEPKPFKPVSENEFQFDEAFQFDDSLFKAKFPEEELGESVPF